jgi:hypothetical protein
VGDHLGGGHRPEAGALGQRPAGGEPPEEPGGEEVARTGGVHHGGHGHRRGRHPLAAPGHGAARRAARHGHHVAAGGGRVQGGPGVGAEQQRQLVLVAEEQVHPVEGVEDERAVALDAPGVRQAERHRAAGPVAGGHGLGQRLTGLRWVEEVALEVADAGRPDDVLVDVGGPELGGGTQEGVHGPLGVRGDDDEATARGRAVGGRRQREGDPDGVDVVGVQGTELVVGHPP